ncbi:MBL fold metallo-hydrolase [Cohnella lubricantis]|uniref:MBL fold metallo-hydrolase n=1 Tax=Cohnella lubricantis TaxID=2163172 RepID=A0A841TAP0_9BACL|nr:MBL fold metallo-hydrolase [Cohnella lubricantis]MBB6678062.1 MBL fold metallo-hydrolase [Cohnella lubricantis]MBP2120040.1 glyoxylase-like metal-dependent hydrolase (beta-lactamase superfamily II) [Cohnella lubricantis]
MNASAGIKGMTSKELTRRILAKEDLFILDVRNENDYNDWRIEGERIVSLNIPYFELLDGVDNALEQIPANMKLLVVCAKEGSSMFVAEQIADAGRTNVHYLEGGMKSWSEHLEPVFIGELQDGGAVYQFLRLGKGCLSYMIVSGGEAAVIDAARMTDRYMAFAQARGITIKHVLDTHLHADHISGGRQLAERTGAAYWLPPKDAEEVTFAYEKLEDGRDITVGRAVIRIQPVYSPGHTIGSTSFVVDAQYLLTGDILFIESIGRPDLAGRAEDWVGDLRDTLYDKYKELSPELLVLPAHYGKMSELGEGGKVMARLSDLYRHNPGLNLQEEEAFRRAVTENLPPQPNAYEEIRQANMGKIKPTEEEQREMETGPNRCAVHDQ